LGPLRARGPGRRPGGPVRPQRGRPHWHGARLDRYRLVPLPYSVRSELRVTRAGVCCSARFLLLSLRSVASPDELSMTFAALADPTRRAILERRRRRGLRRGGHGTAELGRGPCALLRRAWVKVGGRGFCCMSRFDVFPGLQAEEAESSQAGTVPAE